MAPKCAGPHPESPSEQAPWSLPGGAGPTDANTQVTQREWLAGALPPGSNGGEGRRTGAALKPPPLPPSEVSAQKTAHLGQLRRGRRRADGNRERLRAGLGPSPAERSLQPTATAEHQTRADLRATLHALQPREAANNTDERAESTPTLHNPPFWNISETTDWWC